MLKRPFWQWSRPTPSTPGAIADLFGVGEDQVSSIHVLPEGLAIKFTLLRPGAHARRERVMYTAASNTCR